MDPPNHSYAPRYADAEHPEGNAWYVHFPRGYWLYEKSKHLWVSGYPIKAKLYKTPQEFGLHLIWLLSPSVDYMDCCCIHCNTPSLARNPSAADGAAPMLPPNASSSKPPAAFPKVSPVPLPNMPGQQLPTKQTPSAQISHPAQPLPVAQSATLPATAEPAAPAALPPPSQSQPQVYEPAPASGPTQNQALSALPETQPQAQPQALVQPQKQPRPASIKWSLQAPFLFRAGELVWYQNANSWRLGVIAAPGNESFQLTPIGHCAAEQPNVTKVCKEMRPFHAFSVPAVMLPDLQNKAFDQVPWETLFLQAAQDRAKRNNLILDASKMAASKIDASYSLWCPLSEDMSADTMPFYGCFFGAERIEIGDCVRVKPPAGDGGGVLNDSSVLGLTSIVVRKGSPGTVVFRGNMYQLAKQPDDSSSATLLESLPPALQDETRWRRQLSSSQPWGWTLVNENVTLDEQAVRGRFYPTQRLMPILNEPAFNAAVAEGNVESQYPFLNNRMDGSAGYIGHKANRRETLGASVPTDARFMLEPLIREMGRPVGASK